ncbi:hypothetical protein T484DRAFT_1773509 [Baffinella frigidus]|nr:hypothetical protein T484DRAFT_1773509 [Cryptophyta sp. CCMP2293]
MGRPPGESIWDGDAASMEESSNCVQLLDHTQIKLGSKYFTFDQAYDGASRQEDIYTDTVQELVTRHPFCTDTVQELVT